MNKVSQVRVTSMKNDNQTSCILLPVFIEVNGRPWSFLLHFQKSKYAHLADGSFKD